jgi:RNA polymerase sigma factor (sigma-70 family)
MTHYQIEQLHRFYITNRQALFTYALSLTKHRESAEDLLQEVLAKLLQQPGLPRELRPYVFRMVRNRAIDEFRRKEITTTALFDLERLLEESTDKDLLPALEDALNALDENIREVIVLKNLDGLRFREIATILDKPIGTVATWHRRGIEQLNKLLHKESVL